MKKYTLLLTAICLSALTAINAQTERGRIIAGLSSTIHLTEFASTGTDILGLGFVTTKYGDSKYKMSYFNLAPRGGYFVIDNLALGLDIVISSNTENDPDDNDKTTVTVLTAGPFARYYYPLSKFNVFAEAGITFGTYKDKYEYGDSNGEEKAGITTITGGVGAAFPLGDRVTFDVMAGYTHATFKEKDTTNGYKETSGGVGLKMGFMVYFGK